MGDEGDFWNDVKPDMIEESKQRRQRHREDAPDILELHNITYSKFTEAHLLVLGSFEDFDFWPGTGKFIGRRTKKSGRGIFNLIKKTRE